MDSQLTANHTYRSARSTQGLWRIANGRFAGNGVFRRLAVYLGILLMLGTATLALGQTTSGDLVGTVRDSSGSSHRKGESLGHE